MSLYRVTVAGKPFTVEVKEGPEGPIARLAPDSSPARGGGAFSLLPGRGPLATLASAGRTLPVVVARGVEDGVVEVSLPGGRPLACAVEDERALLARAAKGGAGGGPAGPKVIRSVMPGIVLKVLVTPGSSVAAKEPLLVVEAMKMQNDIKAETAGVVTKVHVKVGQSVAAGAPLVELAPPAAG